MKKNNPQIKPYKKNQKATQNHQKQINKHQNP